MSRLLFDAFAPAGGPTPSNIPMARGVLSGDLPIPNAFFRGGAAVLDLSVVIGGAPVAIGPGDPYEVTAIEYTLRAGQLEDAGSPALTLTLGDGIELGASAGQAVITLGSAATASLTPGLHFEQIAVVFAAAPGQYVYVVPPQRRRIVYAAVKVP